MTAIDSPVDVTKAGTGEGAASGAAIIVLCEVLACLECMPRAPETCDAIPGVQTQFERPARAARSTSEPFFMPATAINSLQSAPRQ
jgi:hypothetical protein